MEANGGAKNRRLRFDAGSAFLLLAFATLACNVRYAERLMRMTPTPGREDCHRDRPMRPVIAGAEEGRPPPRSAANAKTTIVAQRRPDYNYNFTIGICAIVKDMDAYLAEWLDYHLGAMRIDNVYLYDNSARFYLENWYRNTRDHPLYRRVEVIRWEYERRPQDQAYRECITMHGRRVAISSYDRFRTNYRGKRVVKEEVKRQIDIEDGNDYIAFIDGDEFLVPKGRYSDVHSVVRDYLEPYGGALTTNWMLFGSSNRTFYSPVPVLKRFQHRDTSPSGVVKTIVRAADFASVRNPHAVLLRDGKLVRTTRHEGAVQMEQFPNVSRTGASDSSLPSNALLLHHYRFLSVKEYDTKNCGRGHMDGKDECNRTAGRTYTGEELARLARQPHIAMRAGKVFDDWAWRMLRDRVPRYRVYDDDPMWGDFT